MVYRLREGIERFLITDINNPAASAKAESELPIQWDVYGATTYNPARGHFVVNPGGFNHIPGGSNVLYMDGHVEFVRYPVKFPLSSWNVILFEMGWRGGG